VEGLVGLSVKLSVSGAAFVFAAIFAMATGSGFGTISTMSFMLYPAGILLGSQSAVLAGAILSGAAFGDNLAPVSDTIFTAFYSWAVWVVMLVTCITGWDRTFEGKDGKIVREKKNK
jgi:uncharacterized membrane protein